MNGRSPLHAPLRNIIFIFCLLLFSSGLSAQGNKMWTAAKANAWYKKQPWLVGCNFIPSTAINELEMWQRETFDSLTIDRELGWAESIGMNVVRVFLHNIPWAIDSLGFKQRVQTFLSISQRHRIQTLFVLFDDCWNPDPKAGKQPAPLPGVHNSGWVQAPGKKMHDDTNSWNDLEAYTKGVLTAFREDNRILGWDLYNEPGNSGYGVQSMMLLKKIFNWAWTVRPSQPITVGIWNNDFKSLNQYQLANSDIISFHNYNATPKLEEEIKSLQARGRPLICTEYMARTNNSRFITHLPVFKKYKVAAINWGLVSGKTNTIFPWNSKQGSTEPATWFHDVFRQDGTPFDKTETVFIRKITASH